MLRLGGVVCHVRRLQLPLKHRSQQTPLYRFSSLLESSPDLENGTRQGTPRLPLHKSNRRRQRVPQKSSDERWNENFALIQADVEQRKRENLDAPMSSRPPSLQIWLDAQRHQYRLKYRDDKNRATDERLAKLESLGIFMFPRDQCWEMRYQQVVEFVEERGYFPYDLDPKSLNGYENRLYWWCWYQKKAYRIYRERQGNGSVGHTTMTPKREALLNEIGFCWCRREAAWMARFEELKAYQRDFGDCLVPRSYAVNPALGGWVALQRKQYVRYKRGQKSTLTERRIALLENIGLEMSVIRTKWLKRYQELQQHVASNGIGSLPLYKHNRSLRMWVDNQQVAYQLWRAGEKSTMTEERAKLWEKLYHRDSETHMKSLKVINC